MALEEPVANAIVQPNLDAAVSEIEIAAPPERVFRVRLYRLRKNSDFIRVLKGRGFSR